MEQIALFSFDYRNDNMFWFNTNKNLPHLKYLIIKIYLTPNYFDVKNLESYLQSLKFFF